MNVDRFVQEFPRLFPDNDPYNADFPLSRVMRTFQENIEGMATENKLMLVNFAASLLAQGETYLEIGCWKGVTIIAAMQGNEQHRFVGIDNFSQFDGPRDEFKANVEQYGYSKLLQFIDDDCFKVLTRNRLTGHRIGVYFYDCEHSYLSQYKALLTIEPYLADEALIIIDDTRPSRVASANRHYLRLAPTMRLLFDLKSAYHGEPKWRNGVQIIGYRRSRKGVDYLFRRVMQHLFLVLMQMRFALYNLHKSTNHQQMQKV